MARKECNKLNFKDMPIKRFSEVYSPRDELIHLLELMSYKLNDMKVNQKEHHHGTLNSWGISAIDRIELGINYK